MGYLIVLVICFYLIYLVKDIRIVVSMSVEAISLYGLDVSDRMIIAAIADYEKIFREINIGTSF